MPSFKLKKGRDNFAFYPFLCLSVQSSLPPSDFPVGIAFPSYLPCAVQTAILLTFTIHTGPTVFHSMVLKTVVGTKLLNYHTNKK